MANAMKIIFRLYNDTQEKNRTSLLEMLNGSSSRNAYKQLVSRKLSIILRNLNYKQLHLLFTMDEKVSLFAYSIVIDVSPTIYSFLETSRYAIFVTSSMVSPLLQCQIYLFSSQINAFLSSRVCLDEGLNIALTLISIQNECVHLYTRCIFDGDNKQIGNRHVQICSNYFAYIMLPKSRIDMKHIVTVICRSEKGASETVLRVSIVMLGDHQEP